MIVSNVIFISYLTKRKRNIATTILKSAPSQNDKSNRQSQMNRTVIIYSVLFIVFTFPMSIVSLFFMQIFGLGPWGLVIIFFIDTVSFAYPAFHFVILYFTNKRFAEKARELFKMKK